MPIEVGLWRMDANKPIRVDFSIIDTETRLEDVIAQDLSILDPNLLLIGRQIPTAYGKFIDLLAIDREGHLVVIELKKDRTPREVVAQVLDYGSWVRELGDDDIAGIFEAYTQKYYPDHAATSLDQAFCEKFGVEAMPDALNEAHELIIVAAQLDDSTERIINYLTEFGVAVNAVFFRFLKDSNAEYLSRAWLIEPEQVEAKIGEKRERLPWNGEYYVSFGGDSNRDWEEARKYGFVSAGGGSWYTKSLSMLEIGARIWVNMPGGIGYVGVGRVIENVVPIDGFMVEDKTGKRLPITSLPLKISKQITAVQDPEKAEHLVRIKWLKTVPTDEAIREKGLFGNQNSAAKPRAKNWPHTIDRLKARFGVTD